MLERDGWRNVRNGWNECGGRCRHNMAAGWTGRLRGMQDGGVRKNATAWTFKRTLERGWTLERENERGKS